jgi:phage/plasmid-like protein (TIGR03299 family)
MADHIFLGKAFVAARNGPAWHKLGTVASETDDWSCEDCVFIGGMDMPYEKVPLQYTTPAGVIVPSKSSFMVLRHPVEGDNEYAEMGVVGPEYQVAQNRDLARGMDRLAQATGWKPETAGLLGRGERFFCTLTTGERSVFGDKYKLYCALMDGKGGQGSLNLTFSQTRLVCWNTWQMVENNNVGRIVLPHGADMLQEFDWWVDTLGTLQQSQDDVFARMEKLAEHKITDEQADVILNAAYPMPAKSNKHDTLDTILGTTKLTALGRAGAQDRLKAEADRFEYQVSLQQGRRDVTFNLYQKLSTGREQGVRQGRELAPETLSIISHTPYAVVQAVNEFVDWGGRDGRRTTESALFGEGAQTKMRAVRAAEELVASL